MLLSHAANFFLTYSNLALWSLLLLLSKSTQKVKNKHLPCFIHKNLLVILWNFLALSSYNFGLFSLTENIHFPAGEVLTPFHISSPNSMIDSSEYSFINIAKVPFPFNVMFIPRNTCYFPLFTVISPKTNQCPWSLEIPTWYQHGISCYWPHAMQWYIAFC